MRVPLPVALVALLAGWVGLSGVGREDDPWPVVGACVVAAVGYVGGRSVPEAFRPTVAGALGALGLAAVLVGEGPLGSPLSGPLGYANANAALAVQAGAAFAVAAVSGREGWLKAVGSLGAGAAVLVCLLIGAAAATAGALLVVLVLLSAGVPGPVARRMTVLLGLATVVGASLLPFVVGAAGGQHTVERLLTDRRVALWSDGVAAIPDDPILGAGARMFPAVSATAARDDDTREAHAELLQRTVENGVPGVLLEAGALAVVVAGLVREAWRRADSRAGVRSAVGLAGVAALWANAGVDWVLGFPVVLGMSAVVAGLAMAGASSSPSGVRSAEMAARP